MSDPSPEMVTLAESLAAVLTRPAPAPDPAAAAPPAAPVAAQAPAVPVAAPEIPAAAVPAELAAAATPAPGTLPAGILSVEELQRREREGASQAGMSHSERVKANDEFCASAEYHARNGSI
jgi:hypothetical protein